MKNTVPERHEYLEVTKVGDELFVFCPKENQAYSLNPTAAKLFGCNSLLARCVRKD